MNPEDDLIESPLQQTYSENGHSVEICIYRMKDTPWTLEVVDVHGNSTVWDEEFESDQAAFDEFFRTVKEEGMESLIGEPSGTSFQPEFDEPDGLLELNDFLMSDAVSDQTMSIDMLDGYLTAIVIGPTTLQTSQWFPGIWGPRAEDAPAFADMDEAKRIMGLIIDYYNDLIGGFEEEANEPLLAYSREEDREYLDGEGWAYGFMQGLALCRPDWQALFDDSQGVKWLKPIRLLGAEDLSEEELLLIETPEQREELALQIEASLVEIHRFWLPHRKAVHEINLAGTYHRDHPKIGRNDPCPCGSGKKYKKCCGMNLR